MYITKIWDPTACIMTSLVMTFVSVNWIIIGSRNQFGAKPLPQAVMIYYQLDTQKQAHKQQFSVN